MDLVRGSVDCEIDGHHEVFILTFRHEIVLVLGIDKDFHLPVDLIGQIDRHLDHRNSVEIMKELVDLLSDLALVFFTQMPVPGAHFDLHDRKPPRVQWAVAHGKGRRDCSRTSGVEQRKRRAHDREARERIDFLADGTDYVLPRSYDDAAERGQLQ